MRPGLTRSDSKRKLVYQKPKVDVVVVVVAAGIAESKSLTLPNTLP